MEPEKIYLYDLSLEEMKGLVNEIGEPTFRAKQIYEWMYKGVDNFDDMRNLPKALKEKLKKIAFIGNLRILKKQVSELDKTAKYLFELKDGNAVEAVFMRYKYGNSICISSQVGCRMGCKFCASGIGGLVRNLTAGEFINQIISVQKDSDEKISHIVVMGTGEAFDNYANLSKFLNLVNSADGLGISMRNITVSTCGIIPKIKAFANDFPQVNLAISLHQTQNEKRSAIMPVNRKYNIEKLIESCKEYFEITKRRVTFEYALISGVNDNKSDIENLAKLLKGFACHVNFIDLNRVEELKFLPAGDKTAKKNTEYLNSLGVRATLRRKLGEDINGACGQLRAINADYKG
ncbi:MAG: 23S rRNA (adenine(2503)-C(2))-methyltransferase RlmN [Eubacteriales bacterium]